MKKRIMAAVFAMALVSVIGWCADEPELVPLKVGEAKPSFRGPDRSIRMRNLEPPRGGKPRPAIMVPKAATNVISRGCRVISSDPHVPSGTLALITDGDKEDAEKGVVELQEGVQWIQLDLGCEREIYAVSVWHIHGEINSYHDVICQLSNDTWFGEGVETIFNNDHDNSSGLGVGSDKNYIETWEGRTFAAGGRKARYVRLYSNGNVGNNKNHYTEVEIYGK